MVDGNTTKRLTERLFGNSGFKVQRKRFSLYRLYQARKKEDMKKYSWPASAVSEKEMKILYDMRQKTKKPISRCGIKTKCW